MGYVIAAYGVTVLTLVGYAAQLLRERGRLTRSALPEATAGREPKAAR